MNHQDEDTLMGPIQQPLSVSIHPTGPSTPARQPGFTFQPQTGSATGHYIAMQSAQTIISAPRALLTLPDDTMTYDGLKTHQDARVWLAHIRLQAKLAHLDEAIWPEAAVAKLRLNAQIWGLNLLDRYPNITWSEFCTRFHNQFSTHGLEDKVQKNLDLIHWESKDTPNTLLQRFEFTALLLGVLTDDEKVDAFRKICPVFLQKFLIEKQATTWEKVKLACEIKTDMNLQVKLFSSSTQRRRDHARQVLNRNDTFQTATVSNKSISSQTSPVVPFRNCRPSNAPKSSKQGFAGRRDSQSRRPTKSIAMVVGLKVIRCNNCKGNHNAVECPSPQVCYFCGQTGYIKRNCPKKVNCT